MIIETPAIVLRSIDYHETSKIVTLLTKKQGKIAVIAKGAKRPKSKFAGLLETGNVIDVIYYYKGSRSVQTLSEAEYRIKTFKLRYNFEKMAITSASIEMIYQLLHENEVNEPMYDLGENLLQWLNDTDKNVRNLFPYIQLRLAEIMGVGIHLDVASIKQNKVGLYLNTDSGRVHGNRNESTGLKLNPDQAHYMLLALQGKTGKLLTLLIESDDLKNLIRILDIYLKHHIEGLKDRTSDTIFEQIL
ncbi:MAG TPA: DNA repair protein RecO [Balneolales bacterium]|nr:DNA repair protein RecO [Balneolales bacterium]